MEEAEVKHLQAETEKLLAEAARLRQQQADEHEQHLRKLQVLEAQVARETAAARVMQLGYEAREREERRLRNSFEQYRVHYFNDPVTAVSTRTCMERLHQWDAEDPSCDIEIVFTSPGGDALAGMALFDYIVALRRGGHHITTTAMGYAASMAAILLQSGERRVMGRESWLLIHEVSAAAVGKVGEIEDTARFLEKLCDRVARIFVQRSGGRISLEEFQRQWSRKDWWLDSQEALNLGFIDEIR